MIGIMNGLGSVLPLQPPDNEASFGHILEVLHEDQIQQGPTNGTDRRKHPRGDVIGNDNAEAGTDSSQEIDPSGQVFGRDRGRFVF